MFYLLSGGVDGLVGLAVGGVHELSSDEALVGTLDLHPVGLDDRSVVLKLHLLPSPAPENHQTNKLFKSRGEERGENIINGRNRIIFRHIFDHVSVFEMRYYL